MTAVCPTANRIPRWATARNPVMDTLTSYSPGGRANTWKCPLWIRRLLVGRSSADVTNNDGRTRQYCALRILDRALNGSAHQLSGGHGGDAEEQHEAKSDRARATADMTHGILRRRQRPVRNGPLYPRRELSQCLPADELVLALQGRIPTFQCPFPLGWTTIS